MNKDFIIEQLKKEFKGKDSFSRKGLFDLYRKFEPDLKDSTFRWRIYQLKEKKVIAQISQDKFSLSYRPVFKPEIEEYEKKIYLRLEKQFPGLKQCIWSTKAINEFMLHLPAKSIIVLEVEKDGPVFDFLKNQNFGTVYI